MFFLVIILFSLSCTSRKDSSKEVLLFNYLLKCPGGEKTACTESCSSSSCGVSAGSPVTSATFACVENCTSSCSSNCDLTGLFLLYLEK